MVNSLREFVNPMVIIPEKGDIELLLAKNSISYYIVPFKNGHRSIGYHNNTEAEEVYSNNILAAEIIVEIIKTNCIHMIHSNSSVVDVGAIAAVKADIPHIWHLREFCEEDFGIEYINKEWKKLLFDYSDFFAISKSVSDAYMHKYGVWSDWAIDCMEDIELSPLDNRFDQDVIYMLIAGTISTGKGQIDAVRAIDVLVNRNICNVRLVIVGHGSSGYIWSLTKLIEARGLQRYVKILPYHNDLAKLRRRCAISLTCSKLEGLGRVTIEAMLEGLTVIGACTGGTKELIGETQERGYLYNQGDYIDLADKIEYVINDIRERDIKREKAQHYIKEQTDPMVYAGRIKETYQNSISNLHRKERNREILIEYISRHPLLEHSENTMKQTVTGNALPNRFRSMFFVAEKWLRINQKGKTVSDYIRDHGYQTVAIYGFGALGSDLYDELNKSRIPVQYVIDRASMDLGEWITQLKPEDILPPVELIIVTAINDFDNIYNNLNSRYPYTIMNLEDILDEILQNNETEWSFTEWDK
jgi:glycosyltransferase involved in cell wall biosynthesis